MEGIIQHGKEDQEKRRQDKEEKKKKEKLQKRKRKGKGVTQMAAMFTLVTDMSDADEMIAAGPDHISEFGDELRGRLS